MQKENCSELEGEIKRSVLLHGLLIFKNIIPVQPAYSGYVKAAGKNPYARRQHRYMHMLLMQREK